ncbi:transporter substrate-binding domain-containing protein [Mesorhizobium sp.]|uniref:transporter substrate-binding domain-containing protein n=1 Tax=Mesorhizobium sp. TaxID=1871066 RepID=UPI000FE6B668|nr:transporter substrate-binding domain-containing protein [Mesorhizobium sp.]RWK11049.1 MAG: transporter substrate-binding domain-containing protein [Mesorhizobium sp.]TIQ49646.1 MAG: transporter substrate-binding domain-containing protein [Mesorhizobium sp.]TIQ59351.1 MAG: transporter substrate-binding domain-containing protein [Mesorhizobium sp.]TJV92015.1 MAG: transporter substrate-binding domain-containing protein [Mesorhizobium sp.]
MSKFRTFAAVASLAVASIALSTAANAGAVLDRVLATKTLTAAVATDWPKQSFLNDNHELDGNDIDVVKGIAKYLGVELKFVTPSWDVIVAGNWEGRWDIAMGGMTPTKARAEKFSFPAIFTHLRSVVVVHKDSKAEQLSDLDGKTVGANLNTTDEYYVRHTLKPEWLGAKPIEFKFTPGEVKTYESYTTGLADLRLGDGVRLDAFVMSDVAAKDAIKAGNPIKQLGDTLYSAPGAIATLRGDKEFDDKVAAAIKSMKDDGTLSKLAIKWYGVDLSAE